METTTHKAPTQIATELKKEAEKNKAFEDVCTVFAMRERARSQVTINSLKAAMDKEGYKHDKDAYKDVISRLARLGVGKLHKDTKGRVRALTDVKYTLQSVGLSAVGEKLNVSPFRKSNRFSALPTKKAVTPSDIREATAQSVPKKDVITALVSNINGKQIEIPLTQKQFTAFLAELIDTKIR